MACHFFTELQISQFAGFIALVVLPVNHGGVTASHALADTWSRASNQVAA